MSALVHRFASVALIGALSSISSAQVTTTWTYEPPSGGTSPVSFQVRATNSTALGDALIGGSQLFNSPTGTINNPFAILVHPDGTVVQLTASMANFTTSSMQATASGSGVYIVVYNIFSGSPRIQRSTNTGTSLWITSVFTSLYSLAPGCLVDNFEDVFVASKTTLASGHECLSMWDASGSFQFTAPCNLSSTPTALAFDSVGDIVVGGATPGTLVKFFSTGVLAWEIPSGLGAEVRRIAWDTNGRGYLLVDGNVLQEVDAAGALGWSAVLPSGGYDDMAVDHQHGVIVTGHSTAPFVTRRYDAAGNLSWERVWNVPPPYAGGAAHFLHIDAAGNAIVAGEVHAPTPTSSTYDAAYVSYTPTGTERWSGIDSSAGRVLHPRGLAVLPDGGFVIAGDLSPNTSSDPGLHVRSFRPQSLAFCFGDGSGAACPCANSSAPGEQRGCSNSSSSAARLEGGGIASIANDTLVLTSSGETPSGATLVFQGSTTLSASAFGDGLRCVGGSIKRLYTHTASAGVVSVPQPGDASISARSAASGDVLFAGSRRHYQAWYRDPSPTFCPAPAGNAWNMSSALSVTWVP